jgi:hypothetical protein
MALTGGVGRLAVLKTKGTTRMKHSIFAITILALGAAFGTPALAQTQAPSPPVTMQPVPNPPETPVKTSTHHGKRHTHHNKAPAKT